MRNNLCNIILLFLWGIKFGKGRSPRNATVSTQTGARDGI